VHVTYKASGEYENDASSSLKLYGYVGSKCDRCTVPWGPGHCCHADLFVHPWSIELYLFREKCFSLHAVIKVICVAMNYREYFDTSVYYAISANHEFFPLYLAEGSPQ
jgi:hypothetical protein